MKLKFIKYFCVILLIISGLNSNIYSEELNIEQKFSVEFVGSISKKSDVVKSKGFFKKISDFIFGTSDVYFSKPNGIIKIDNSEIVIIDQGLNNVFNIVYEDEDFDVYDFSNDSIYLPSLACISNKDEKIYFTDSKLNKIFTIINNQIFEFDVKCKLSQPTGIACFKNYDAIAISETALHRILIISSNGEVLDSIGMRGTEIGSFNYPTYLWIDKDDNLYVNDAMNFRIQIFSKSGEFIAKFGEQGDGSGFFASIKGIATDSYNHIYVVDAIFHCVQVFDKQGNFLYRFGSKGNKESEFILPSGIYIDKEDYIYIADSFNSRIQIFKLKMG